MATQRQTAAALLGLHGQTFAHELRIDAAKNTPTELFRLLCAASLMSARISSEIAVEAARNLSRRRWRSARKLADSSWDERVDALHAAGYTRYQERTATMLGDMACHALDRWGGDLRQLREEAERDPRRERRLLKELKSVGDVGVDIFFREVQVAWDELAPFADRRALQAAHRLKLGRDAQALTRLVGERDFPRLVAALIRVELADDYGAVRRAARDA